VQFAETVSEVGIAALAEAGTATHAAAAAAATTTALTLNGPLRIFASKTPEGSY
jgi:hypothetical protein